jgi:hypothetical protein
MKTNKTLFTILILISLATPLFGYNNSFERFDTSLVQGVQYTYEEPKKLLFTQIKGNYDILPLNPEEYLNTIYYYCITKLKLGNIPYHYIVDESGNIYKTQTYDAIKLLDQAYIVVGYLSNNGQLSNKASTEVFNLTDDLSYKYGLTEYEIFGYSIKETEETFSQIQLQEPNSLFKESINSTLENWSGYKEEHLEYDVNIENVEHAESVEIGKQLEVKVTIKNNNDFIWTSDRYPMYISVKDSQESPFAVNEVWDSFSKPTHLASEEYILPGQTAEFTFSLHPKVEPGEYSETFNILKFADRSFENSEFTVEFTVTRGEGTIVRIDSPEYGFVNIRNCRRFSCDKVDVVNDGEVYPVVEYHESCWYKIKYGEEKEGWFYCPFAEEIE